MELRDIGPEDRELIAAAQDVLERSYRPVRHTVGAAVRSGSGRIYVGVNVEACGYGPCAEPIALGAAFSNGEREILAMVAVCVRDDGFGVLSPCGNCRQLLMDYCPTAEVILEIAGKMAKSPVRDLLPAAYLSGFDEE